MRSEGSPQPLASGTARLRGWHEQSSGYWSSGGHSSTPWPEFSRPFRGEPCPCGSCTPRLVTGQLQTGHRLPGFLLPVWQQLGAVGHSCQELLCPPLIQVYGHKACRQDESRAVRLSPQDLPCGLDEARGRGRKGDRAHPAAGGWESAPHTALASGHSHRLNQHPIAPPLAARLGVGWWGLSQTPPPPDTCPTQ